MPSMRSSKMFCRRPWKVQLFNHGASYYFETDIEAYEFMNQCLTKIGMEGVIGPILDAEGGRQAERETLLFVTAVIEEERNS